MIKELIKLSTHLDGKGCHKEADYLDAVIKKIAETRTTVTQTTMRDVPRLLQMALARVTNPCDYKLVEIRKKLVELMGEEKVVKHWPAQQRLPNEGLITYLKRPGGIGGQTWPAECDVTEADKKQNDNKCREVHSLMADLGLTQFEDPCTNKATKDALFAHLKTLVS